MLICLTVAVEVLATQADVSRMMLGVRVTRAEDFLPLTPPEVGLRFCALHDDTAGLGTDDSASSIHLARGVLEVHGVHFG